MHIMKANISYAGVLMYIYGSAHGDTIGNFHSIIVVIVD